MLTWNWLPLLVNILENLKQYNQLILLLIVIVKMWTPGQRIAQRPLSCVETKGKLYLQFVKNIVDCGESKRLPLLAMTSLSRMVLLKFLECTDPLAVEVNLSFMICNLLSMS